MEPYSYAAARIEINARLSALRAKIIDLETASWHKIGGRSIYPKRAEECSRDAINMIEALAKSIELAPSAPQAPPVPVDGLAEIAKRLRDLELRTADMEGRFTRLRDAVEA